MLKINISGKLSKIINDYIFHYELFDISYLDIYNKILSNDKEMINNVFGHFMLYYAPNVKYKKFNIEFNAIYENSTLNYYDEVYLYVS